MPSSKELEQKIQRELQAIEKAKRKAAMYQAQISKQKRAEDTKRKVLIGAAAFAASEKDEAFKSALYAVLDKYITRKSDRELLGIDVTIHEKDDVFRPCFHETVTESGNTDASNTINELLGNPDDDNADMPNIDAGNPDNDQGNASGLDVMKRRIMSGDTTHD